jgi:hypothetical protein
MDVAERVRRHRARKRGEPVEKIRPGPKPKEKPSKKPKPDIHEVVLQSQNWRVWDLGETTHAKSRFRVEEKRGARWKWNRKLTRSRDFAVFIEDMARHKED